MPRSNAPKITMIFGPERGCTVMPLLTQVLSNLLEMVKREAVRAKMVKFAEMV